MSAALSTIAIHPLTQYPLNIPHSYLYGQVALAVLMLITGILGSIPENQSANYAIGAMLIIFTGVYDCSVGPVCYSLVAEMSSTRLRSKSVILARNFYNLASLITGIM